MSGNRKAATEELVRLIDAMMPGSPNTANTRARLEAMSDKQFDDYMSKLESGELAPTIVVPPLGKHKLSIERNLDIAESLGHNFFERVWMTDPTTGTEYLTPIPYLIVDLPLRRQQQLLVKKASIPDDNDHVDELTDQPTGVSKSSTMSFPEMQVLHGQGQEKIILELIKFRGGDTKAFNAMNKAIMQYGAVSIDQLSKMGTRVKATESVSAFLNAMHMDHTL